MGALGSYKLIIGIVNRLYRLQPVDYTRLPDSNFLRALTLLVAGADQCDAIVEMLELLSASIRVNRGPDGFVDPRSLQLATDVRLKDLVAKSIERVY